MGQKKQYMTATIVVTKDGGNFLGGIPKDLFMFVEDISVTAAMACGDAKAVDFTTARGSMPRLVDTHGQSIESMRAPDETDLLPQFLENLRMIVAECPLGIASITIER